MRSFDYRRVADGHLKTHPLGRAMELAYETNEYLCQTTVTGRVSSLVPLPTLSECFGETSDVRKTNSLRVLRRDE